MASLQTKFNVGLFLIIGFIICLVAIVWLGMSHFLEKGHYYEAFFDESVQGLDKDSLVKYRGVTVGRVKRISVAPDTVLIKTVLKIEAGIEPGIDMVAQLKSVGITGIMYIELDKKLEGEPDLSPKITFPTEYPTIKTKPSDIKQFIGNINDVFNQIKQLDIGSISESLTAAMDEINRAVASLKTDQLSAAMLSSLKVWDNALTSVNSAATSFDKTVNRLNRVVTKNDKSFTRAVSRADELLTQGTRFIHNTDNNIHKLMVHLMVTIKNIEMASENLNRSLELISDQPSQLLFGKPVPPRNVE